MEVINVNAILFLTTLELVLVRIVEKLSCRDLNYGYGCKQSCECVHGKYNGNTTHANESCTCDPRYQPPLSFQLIDQCAINSPCNNATEDRALDPNNCITICACQLGDERPNTTTICIGMSNQ
ncbi:unnamed protein product [Rotaria sp. Silwood1]|nr:unnamed protein product [Rotaria sp. Silwood1]